MRDKLMTLYTNLLAVGWLYPDEHGQISAKIANIDMPAMLGDKRLVLPTREQMKNKDWSKRVPFHPLSEQLNLGVSDVLAEFRKQVESRLNTSIGFLIKNLIRIAVDVEGQKNLTSEQGQVLNILSKAKVRTQEKYDELEKKMRAAGVTNGFLNLFIRRGGMIGGQGFTRAGIATFPLYNELCEGNKTINGVTFGKDDHAMFKELHEFIFPTLLTDKEWYNVGVNQRTAPTVEAFVRLTIRLISDLMETARPYMDIMPGSNIILNFPQELGDWISLFDDADEFERARRAVPPQDGNEGSPNPKEGQDEGRARRLESSKREEVEPEERESERREVVREEDPVQSAAGGFRAIGSRPSEIKPEYSTAKKGTTSQPVQSGRGIDHAAIERERREREEQDDREWEDRERRRREREDEEDRIERDRRRRRQDERDREYDRDRDRDRDRRRGDDYGRRDERDDDDRERGRKRSLWDNPIAQDLLDESEREERYGNRRGSRDRDYDRGRDRDRDRYGRGDDRDRYGRRRR